jgi:two-component system, OmpR family, sensor histidine kinase VicK
MGLFSRSNKNTQRGGSHLPANLQDESQKFKVIFDSLKDGVVMVDAEGTIQMFNPGAVEICGWSADEANGINIKTVINLVNEKGEAINEHENPIHNVLSTGQSIQTDDAILLTRDGQQMPIRLSVSPLFDEHKRVSAAVAVMGNISEQRAQEKQRADFISTASHEMRTPVAAIEGYLALALNEKVSTIDGRARGYLEKAHSSTQHLGQLFQDLLTSAKAEDGRLTSHPAVMEIGEFLEQLASDLRLVAEQKNLSVEFISGSSQGPINATNRGGERVVRPLYYVFADADRLREVITNLFDNAVKYTPEGKVSLGLTGNDKVVQCYVRDTGPGIPPEDLPHLFQKFYRVDNSATRTIGGTGLGLFICRKIVELYNGHIWAESQIGKGSTFYINLPRLTDQKANELRTSNDLPATRPLNSA